MYPALPTPPAATGSVYHDGMAAIRFVIEHLAADTFPCDASACLATSTMLAACHVAPLATARPPATKHADGTPGPVQENAKALATITDAIRRIASALRIRTKLENEDRERIAAQLSPQVAADDKPNTGPMAPLLPTPTPQPPQAPALPAPRPMAPRYTAPAPIDF